MHLSVPKQVYGDLVSNGKNNSLIHGIVPLFGFAVARFFARITTFALMIHEHAINVKHFFRENWWKCSQLTTFYKNFGFLSTFFYEKS